MLGYLLGVDVRTSKACELGILNYKAKRVLYPSEKSIRFPCRYDYYWSAIFEVINNLFKSD